MMALKVASKAARPYLLSMLNLKYNIVKALKTKTEKNTIEREKRENKQTNKQIEKLVKDWYIEMF